MLEAGEFVTACNYRYWKPTDEVDVENLKEELADILHFALSISLKLGLTAKDIYDLYRTKNRENIKRQLGLSRKGGYNSNLSEEELNELRKRYTVQS